MKKKDTLDRRLGPTIREIGNRHGLSVTNLKSALAESFNDRRKGWADENVEYGEETIGGYLYDRTWPDMECQTCIDTAKRFSFLRFHNYNCTFTWYLPCV